MPNTTRTLPIILVILVAFSCSSYSFGQKRAKSDLLRDLNYLNEAVINGHPVNYDPAFHTDLNELVDEASKISTDSISTFQYVLWIEKAIYQIGCVHTGISKNPLNALTTNPSYIPLSAAIVRDQLMITHCADSSQIGRRIISINGEPAASFITTFAFYKASDGGTNAFSRAYFHFASSRLISWKLGNPESFTIQTDQGTFTQKASKTFFFQEKTAIPPKIELTKGASYFYYLSATPVLKLASFQKGDEPFIRQVFARISTHQDRYLILDLRQNTGGNRHTAVELTRHLVDSSFSYSVLEPHLHTKKYLNGKGRFYLSLSRLKYNIGNVFKGHKTDLGRNFVYRYEPAKSNRFHGKIIVLTDGFTASSSTIVMTWLKLYTDAIFIGSQASGGYNGNNGGSYPIITLPASLIEIRFPAYRIVLDPDSPKRDGLIPDVITDGQLPGMDFDLQEALRLIGTPK